MTTLHRHERRSDGSTLNNNNNNNNEEKKKPRFIPGPNAGKIIPQQQLQQQLQQSQQTSTLASPIDEDTDDGLSHNDGRNVYIAGLTMSTKDDDLRSTCSDYGTVLACEVVRDPHTGDSRGFAFVTMKTKQEADLLISALDGTLFDGKQITCRLSRRGGPRKGTPGTYLGTRKDRYYRNRAAQRGLLLPYDIPPPPYRDRRDYLRSPYDDDPYYYRSAYAAYAPPPPAVDYYFTRAPISSRSSSSRLPLAPGYGAGVVEFPVAEVGGYPPALLDDDPQQQQRIQQQLPLLPQQQPYR